MRSIVWPVLAFFSCTEFGPTKMPAFANWISLSADGLPGSALSIMSKPQKGVYAAIFSEIREEAPQFNRRLQHLPCDGLLGRMQCRRCIEAGRLPLPGFGFLASIVCSWQLDVALPHSLNVDCCVASVARYRSVNREGSYSQSDSAASKIDT